MRLPIPPLGLFHLPPAVYFYKMSGMDARTNLQKPPFNQWRAISLAFQECRSSVFWALKKLTLTFGLIWLPFSALVLFSAGFLLSGFPLDSIKLSLSLFEKCFTIFLVPYFAYKFLQNKEGVSVESFNDFLAETIVPLIIASIKAVFVVIGYLCLLIVPGIIKGLRLSLLTYTVFFDPRVRGQRISPLKAAQETTKGALLSILGVYLVLGLTGKVLAKLLLFALKLGVTDEDIFLTASAETLTYFFEFYWRSFEYVFITCFFLILQKRTEPARGGIQTGAKAVKK